MMIESPASNYIMMVESPASTYIMNLLWLSEVFMRCRRFQAMPSHAAQWPGGGLENQGL